MMSSEITEIINTLCEKLGVAANVLVPEMARYYIARLAFLALTQTIFAIILGIVFARIMKWILSIYSKEEYDWKDEVTFPVLFANLFLGIIVIFLVLSACSNAADLIGWVASPSASAVREITRLIK